MRILVAYDGSISADAAIEDLRKAGLPEQGQAMVLCVADGQSLANETAEKTQTCDCWKSRLACAQGLAEKAGERIRAYFPQWSVSQEALWGTPAKIIMETSGWWHPDLLVLGSHGRSRAERFFLGSVSLELIHKATCSVRVARLRGLSERQGAIRIVIGNDGSAEAQAVIHAVAARSWPPSTEARVVAVVQTLVPAVEALEASTFAQEPAYSVIHEADERLRCRLAGVAAESTEMLRRAGLSAASRVIDGDPREVLLNEARRLNADAIFVGAHGMGRIERLLLGRISSHIVAHADRTVEVVRNFRG